MDNEPPLSTFNEVVDHLKTGGWRPVKKFPGYFVNSEGEAKHWDKKLTPSFSGGRRMITLPHSLRGKMGDGVSSFSIARAVASAFVPNPESKPFVSHINKDVLDDRKSNLRWADRAELVHSISVTKRNNKIKKGKI